MLRQARYFARSLSHLLLLLPVHQAAALKVLRERAGLAKAIAALEPAMAGLKDFTATNAGLVSAMQGLTQGLAHVPAELPSPAGTTA